MKKGVQVRSIAISSLFHKNNYNKNLQVAKAKKKQTNKQESTPSQQSIHLQEILKAIKFQVQAQTTKHSLELPRQHLTLNSVTLPAALHSQGLHKGSCRGRLTWLQLAPPLPACAAKLPEDLASTAFICDHQDLAKPSTSTCLISSNPNPYTLPRTPKPFPGLTWPSSYTWACTSSAKPQTFSSTQNVILAHE